MTNHTNNHTQNHTKASTFNNHNLTDKKHFDAFSAVDTKNEKKQSKKANTPIFQAVLKPK